MEFEYRQEPKIILAYKQDNNIAILQSSHQEFNEGGSLSDSNLVQAIKDGYFISIANKKDTGFIVIQPTILESSSDLDLIIQASNHPELRPENSLILRSEGNTLYEGALQKGYGFIFTPAIEIPSEKK